MDAHELVDATHQYMYVCPLFMVSPKIYRLFSKTVGKIAVEHCDFQHMVHCTQKYFPETETNYGLNQDIFASQGYLVHFVPYAKNEVDLVPLACEDDIRSASSSQFTRIIKAFNSVHSTTPGWTFSIIKKVKVHGEPQSHAAANPWHQGKDKKDKK